MATIIDGKKLAQEVKNKLADEVSLLKQKGITPGLAVVLVGHNPASQVYVRNKRKACEEVGITGFDFDLPATASQEDVERLVTRLNSDTHVHGILVQLPLPSQLDEQKILWMIDPEKDVDGFHPLNLGRLVAGLPCLRPCTPSGILEIIHSMRYDLSGKHAVVVGRSRIVGKPVALMLLERHATVTICHSRTRDLADIVRSGDIVVAAIGSAHFIKGDWIKKGALVIDVGINRTDGGKLAGDVDFDGASKIASAITPVPGGVGPMTIAMLLKNVVESAKHSLLQGTQR